MVESFLECGNSPSPRSNKLLTLWALLLYQETGTCHGLRWKCTFLHTHLAVGDPLGKTHLFTKTMQKANLVAPRTFDKLIIPCFIGLLHSTPNSRHGSRGSHPECFSMLRRRQRGSHQRGKTQGTPHHNGRSIHPRTGSFLFKTSALIAREKDEWYSSVWTLNVAL